jgi:hypothetical protein
MQIKNQEKADPEKTDSQRIIIIHKEGIYKLKCRNYLGFERKKNRAFEIGLEEYINRKYIGKVNLTFARCVIHRNYMYSKTANTVEIRYIEMRKKRSCWQKFILCTLRNKHHVLSDFIVYR